LDIIERSLVRWRARTRAWHPTTAAGPHHRLAIARAAVKRLRGSTIGRIKVASPVDNDDDGTFRLPPAPPWFGRWADRPPDWTELANEPLAEGKRDAPA
jgi:hypothetical protein